MKKFMRLDGFMTLSKMNVGIVSVSNEYWNLAMYLGQSIYLYKPIR